MSDLVTIALEVFAEFGRPDVDGHAPHPVYSWLATSGAHLGMGMGLALGLVWWPQPIARTLRACVPIGFLGLWALKELLFDLPSGGFSLLTWVDSAADLACGAAGFRFAGLSLGVAVETTVQEAGHTST